MARYVYVCGRYVCTLEMCVCMAIYHVGRLPYGRLYVWEIAIDVCVVDTTTHTRTTINHNAIYLIAIYMGDCHKKNFFL